MDPRQPLPRATSSNLPPTQQYPPNTMTSPYNIQYQHPQGAPHLPPIHNPQQAYQQSPYMPQYRPELPRYQSAPTPSHPDRFNPQPQLAPQPLTSLPPATLLPQPSHPYPQSQHYAPASSAQAFPPRIAPAPPRSDLATLAASFTQPEGRVPLWTTADGMPAVLAESPRDPVRAHVVGSQGRRGILPSAPGRPAPAPDGATGSPKNAAIPPKDADGKFPCPNCTKTYLHAKHLKRHMLRHTGDRPYMCVLCRDTFSRSDILKRHFQKCSVRRGNPNNLSHLSSPAAHLKKGQAVAAKAGADALSSASTPTTTALANGGFTSTAPAPSNVSAGPSPYTEAPSMAYNLASAPNNSLQRPAAETFVPTSQGSVTPSVNGSFAPHNARPNPMLYQSTPASPQHFGIAANNPEDRRSVMPAPPAPAGEDFFFSGGGNDGYMNPMYSTSMGPGYEHGQNGVKSEAPDGNSNEFYLPSNNLGADGLASRRTS